jgi:nucleotide-binding universal stress UspA family protein
MYRVLMVPTDGSELSRYAIPWALALARPAAAAIHLVQVTVPAEAVVAPSGLALDPGLLPQLRAGQEDALAGLAERLSIGTGVSFTPALVEGDAPSALLDYARDHRVDLVVMSTHGRGGVSRALLGSVSDAMIRKARVPVLLTRPDNYAPEEREEAAASDILVPLAGTPASEEIIPHVTKLATALGSSCTLFHVAVPLRLQGAVPTDALVDDRDVTLDAEKARAYLAPFAARLIAEGIPATVAVHRGTNPAAEILDYCTSHPVSMIAMVTAGRHGLDRAVAGSVESTLLHRTRLPMLVVRATESSRIATSAARA